MERRLTANKLVAVKRNNLTFIIVPDEVVGTGESRQSDATGATLYREKRDIELELAATKAKLELALDQIEQMHETVRQRDAGMAQGWQVVATEALARLPKPTPVMPDGAIVSLPGPKVSLWGRIMGYLR
jgi:hypothetical protein